MNSRTVLAVALVSSSVVAPVLASGELSSPPPPPPGDPPVLTVPDAPHTTLRLLGGGAVTTGAAAAEGGVGALALELGGESLSLRGSVEAGRNGAAAGLALLLRGGDSLDDLRPYALLEVGALATPGLAGRTFVGAGAGLEWRVGAMRLCVEAHARYASHEDDLQQMSDEGGNFLVLSGAGFSF